MRRLLGKNKLTWDKYVDITLYVFIVSMIVIFEGKNSFLYLLIMANLCLAFLGQIKREKKILFDKKVIWLIAFFVLSAVSCLWAVDINNALSVLPILFMNEFMAYIVMVLIYRKPSRLKGVMKAIIIGTILLGIRIILQYGPLVFIDKRMVDGFSANMLGLYGAIATNLVLYLLIKNKKAKYTLQLVVCLLIVVISFSRKAIVFSILPMIVCFVFSKRDSLKSILLRSGITIAALIIGITSLYVVPELHNTMGVKFEAMINGVLNTGNKTDASVKARMNFIKYGEEMFEERPIQGWGLNNFKNMIAVRKPKGMTNTYAHNNYIEIAVDLGVIGLIVYYSLYVYMLMYGIRYYKKLDYLQLLMLSFLVTLAICEYGLVSYYNDFIHLLLTMIWMSLMYYGDIGKRNKECSKRKMINS